MIKVGLTGGIGSGKTTVANAFKALDVPVYVSDVEAKKLMGTSKVIQKKLIKAFGEKAYIDGELNRPYIAKLVFNNKEKLALINSIVHPKVAQHYSKWIQRQDGPYCIQENAIIFENNKASEFDYIIMVTAPLTERIERVMQRDSSTKGQVLARINNQWSDAKKNKLAHFIIKNNDLENTIKQVKVVHQKLLHLSSENSTS